MIKNLTALVSTLPSDHVPGRREDIIRVARKLDLMQEALLERLRAEVGDQAPQALRFRVNSARF